MRDDIDLNDIKKRLEERLEAIIAGQKANKDENAPVELDQARVGRLHGWMPCSSKPCLRPRPAWSRLNEAASRWHSDVCNPAITAIA